MIKKTFIILPLVLLAVFGLAQENPPKSSGDQAIKISTDLVQLDAVVVDKNGKVVRGLSKDDFELYDAGKKQLISFFEFVDAGKGSVSALNQPQTRKPEISTQGPAERDIRRIYAFVVDDLTIRYEDMTYVRDMLNNFVDNQMQPTDLVAIVRVVGGQGLLQQFTTDKELLRRSIAKLTPTFNPFNVYNAQDTGTSVAPTPAQGSGPDVANPGSNFGGGFQDLGGQVDINSPTDETNITLRGYMTLGTASFVIDSMKQLPGRKSMVLVSGGLPILGVGANVVATNITNFLDVLADRATRAGVAINTLDIRGLSAQTGVAHFSETPGKSGLGMNAPSGAFGRQADESMLGYNQPIDVTAAHMGLRQLSSSTGGIAALNRNDFKLAMEKIIDSTEGYYLLAYTPTDSKFNGEFHKIEIKVKGGYKVLSRRGYMAIEEKPAAAPVTKQDQLLAAIKSPLARRDIDLDAALIYKGVPSGGAVVDVQLLVDPKKLGVKQAGEKQQTNFDVAGFVFDQLGKLRGGFNETVTAAFTADEYNKALEGGIPYVANTALPPGIYQIRIAVRDSTSEAIGTISRYLEVPDLSKGRLAMSSLMLGSVPAGDTKAASGLSESRRFHKNSDLRYAAIIYNAREKAGAPEITTSLLISHNGQVMYKEPEQPLRATTNGNLLTKVGQLGLAHVPPGRYTATVVVTDNLADKKFKTVSRSMDFIVVP